MHKVLCGSQDYGIKVRQRTAATCIYDVICDPTQVNEADVGRGQFWEIFISVLCMDYGLFQYQDLGCNMSLSKSYDDFKFTTRSNSKFYISSYGQLKNLFFFKQVNVENMKECPQNIIFLCN